jgi:26S proteasome regulatory subunit N9
MGDVQLFKELSMKKYATQISNTPALHHRTMVVLEKVTLLSLIHMITERPSNERTLSFMEIATRLNVPITSVELVIMRALSLQLLEGRMDQVEQTLSVTWVMPRVLNSSQTQDLATRFGEWAIRVSKTRDMMKEQTTTLLV